MHYKNEKAFTLIELLVVISVITLLLAILTPALAAARAAARALVCRTNLHQLLIANIAYAGQNDGFFVPAASDMWDSPGLHRWHGTRDSLEEPFDPLRGPLAAYLSDGKLKKCPERINFIQSGNWNQNFEHGCGGYGYNMTYIGSRLWQPSAAKDNGFRTAYECTTNITEVTKPAQTLMFADTAMSNEKGTYIEYSFAEPPFTVQEGRVVTGFYMSPSIHFRHKDYANIGWADGHTDQRGLAKPSIKNAYGVNSADMKLGWFEPVNNSLFDLK